MRMYDKNKATSQERECESAFKPQSDLVVADSPLLPLTNISKLTGYKTFSDSIHGQIELPALCVRILDTPEMQRLHRLKQLGVCDYVFRCANHTRLEHSIGVAHQANVLLSTLETQYRRAKETQRMLKSRDLPALTYIPPKISEVDKLCVLVACLCHDLGHGPFSHHFEDVLRELDVHRFTESKIDSE